MSLEPKEARSGKALFHTSADSLYGRYHYHCFMSPAHERDFRLRHEGPGSTRRLRLPCMSFRSRWSKEVRIHKGAEKTDAPRGNRKDTILAYLRRILNHLKGYL